MAGDAALVEDDMLHGIDAGRDEGGRDLAGGGSELRRVVPDRHRMEVDHAVEAVVTLLQGHEPGDRA